VGYINKITVGDSMILDKKVTIKWSAKNINYYRDKGYEFRKFGEELTVKVEELPENAHVKVKAKCEYCGDTKLIRFQDYNTYINKNNIKKYACKPCSKKKLKENIKILYEQGDIQKGDNFYFSIKENRVKELKESLEKYGTLAHIYESGLQQHFANHNHDLLQAIEDLGYDHMKLRQQKPNNYWDNYENVKEPIEDFISLYKRFPTSDEMRFELRICGKAIVRHGGVNEIKKKMNYKNNKDFIDNNGDYNRSTYELITANFLIAQKIPYKREQSPFPKFDGRYRSDFTLYTENQKLVHIEIWGLSKNENSERAAIYLNRRNKKESLYKKHDINVISIEPEVFKQSYSNIEKDLNNILSKYLNLKFKKVEQKALIPARELSDEQLLEVVMKYSDNSNFLPKARLICIKESGIYKEIVKRYENFRNFGEKFGINMKTHTTNYWTEEKIQEKLLYMIETYGEYYGGDLLKKIQDPYLLGLEDAMQTYGGSKYHRLKIYKYCLENNVPISNKDKYHITTRFIRDESLPIDTPLIDIINFALDKIEKQKGA
jgi:hypothetical protein